MSMNIGIGLAEKAMRNPGAALAVAAGGLFLGKKLLFNGEKALGHLPADMFVKPGLSTGAKWGIGLGIPAGLSMLGTTILWLIGHSNITHLAADKKNFFTPFLERFYAFFDSKKYEQLVGHKPSENRTKPPEAKVETPDEKLLRETGEKKSGVLKKLREKEKKRNDAQKHSAAINRHLEDYERAYQACEDLEVEIRDKESNHINFRSIKPLRARLDLRETDRDRAQAGVINPYSADKDLQINDVAFADLLSDSRKGISDPYGRFLQKRLGQDIDNLNAELDLHQAEEDRIKKKIQDEKISRMSSVEAENERLRQENERLRNPSP